MPNTVIGDAYPRNAHLPNNELQSQSDDRMEFIELSTDSQHSQQQQRQILFQYEVESEKKRNLLLLLCLWIGFDPIDSNWRRSTGQDSHRFPHQLALIFIRQAFAQRQKRVKYAAADI